MFCCIFINSDYFWIVSEIQEELRGLTRSLIFRVKIILYYERKGRYIMITFTVLALIALAVTVISIILLVVGGTGFIVVFGDLIICVVLIVMLIRFIFKRKN